MNLTSPLEAQLSSGEAPPADDPELVAQVDALLPEVGRRLSATRLPVSTYRLQFHARFTLRRAEQIVPYLAALGITDVYASPLLQATAGSQHGYDVVDHASINSEIGDVDDLESFTAALRAHQMGLVMDVVPNHMSAASELNAWWRDVLEHGPSSRFANFFDIDWMPLKPDLAQKVLLPVLEDQFGKVLEAGLLAVEYDAGTFWIRYHERRYPVAPASRLLILDWRVEELQAQLGADDPLLLEFLSILTALRNLPPRTETDAERLDELHRESETSKRRLQTLTDQSAIVAQFVAENVRRINGQVGAAASFDRLDQLIEQQAYRLAYWRTATDEINYRRFFDINELAAICMERPEVFEATHAQVFAWIEQGIVGGLRIDHPDGLYDPPGYLRQLQEVRYGQLCRQALADLATDGNEVSTDERSARVIARAIDLWREASRIPGSPLARPLYVVVEKILGHHEVVPLDWLVYGTVGYEFLNALGGLFVDPAGEKPISATYTRFTGESLNFRELEYTCKRLIARMSMASELHVLGYQLDRMSERNRRTRDFTLTSLIEAVQEVVSCFSVYRTYVQDEVVLEHDRQYIESAVARAKRRNPAMEESVFDFLRDVLLLRHSELASPEQLEQQRRFVGKFQQLTGPIMAKSVEDTAFYRFNRLVALNEVGGEPARFGTDAAGFHRLNAERLPRLSHGLSSTTTHDTKRSEDARARISVLSEVPREWRAHAMRWARWNRRLKTNVDGVDAPSRNDEYLLYQTLIGVWPGNISTGEPRERFTARLRQYALKVAREAKANTSWINQHQAYEQALEKFVEGVLEVAPRRPFWDDLSRFAEQVAVHGDWNSLAQLVLKIGSPGVPDFFQGTENWTLTLVDPDNRGEVDFATRQQALEQLERRIAAALASPGNKNIAHSWIERCLERDDTGSSQPNPVMTELIAEMLQDRRDGRIKLFCMLLALHARRARPKLFCAGDYIPLAAQGAAADNIVAFARRQGTEAVLVVAPRWTVRLCGFGGPPPIGTLWGDTTLELPDELAGKSWCNIYSGERYRSVNGLPLSSVLSHLPAAILVATPS